MKQKNLPLKSRSRMNGIKRIPYGVSDFKVLKTENYYYVDKTHFIPIVEDEGDWDFLFFTRPRRFGKSLWISMLAAYYDIYYKDRFEQLFGDLWIGSHKTSQQGRYQVLTLDFSNVGGSPSELKENFNKHACFRLDDFMRKYESSYPEDIVADFFATKDANDKIQLVCIAAQRLEIPLFLIIDEYDNFTNTVLNEHGEGIYHAITHADGFYRDIFKKFKGSFRRIILTGVSPVTLDDLTSGFNIGWNITMAEDFNQMLGFSEEEVYKMFRYYEEEGALPQGFDVTKAIEEMKPWYDDYCFSPEASGVQSKVFNSDMVLFYLRNLIRRKRPPKDMLDPNTGTDYAKLRRLLQLDKLDGDRKGVLMKIIEEGQIVEKIEDSFPARMLTNPKIFTSLLFYYGMLTVKGVYGTLPILGIPNNNVRKLYYNYLLEQYNNYMHIDSGALENSFNLMAINGIWKPCIQYLADAYAKVASVRDGIEGERNIQGFFMAYLSTCSYYILAPELELNHGFCDFFLLPYLSRYPDTRHSYIIELKFINKKDWTETAASTQWDAAVKQIKRYAESPRVRAMQQGTCLHKVVVQFCGWEIKRMETVD